MFNKDTGMEFKHFHRKDMSSKIQETIHHCIWDEPLTDLFNNTIHTCLAN